MIQSVRAKMQFKACLYQAAAEAQQNQWGNSLPLNSFQMASIY